MQLIESSSSDKDLYNRFVAESPSGSFLQSFEWGSWQEILGRKILRYWILDDTGQKLGSIQLIKMPLPFGRFYLYAPYGPVLALSENPKSQIPNPKFLVLELEKKFPDAVFIRIEPKFDLSPVTSDPLLIKSANIQPAKTLLIDLSKTSEQLLAEMHPKTRYNIKVAQKHGVEIVDEFAITVGHGLFFDEALKLILATSKRQGFVTFGANYYKKLVDFFSLGNLGEVKLHIYKAIFQNQLLSAAIIMDFAGTRTFLFGGSSEFHKNVMAPYLLHWIALQDAQVQGLKFYDFWGIETASGATPGFVKFKLGFGGQERQYEGAYDIVINKFIYKVYLSLRQVNKIIKKIYPR